MKRQMKLTRLLTLPAGRRAKWIVLLLWLVPVLALSSFSGKLNGAEQNDPSSFTPTGAESTTVSNLDTTVFPGGNEPTAIVVYHRASGLTAADRVRVQDDFAYFSGAGRPPYAARPIMGKPAADGKLASFSMVLLTTDPTSLTRSVQLIRAIVAHQRLSTGELRSKYPTLTTAQLATAAGYLAHHSGERGSAPETAVTGPAGILVDAISSFGSIDGMVLLATVCLVLVLLLLIYRSPIIALVPLITVFAAFSIAGGIVYLLAEHAGLAVNSQAGGILPVLMFGAGTDYALLLVARYREELHRHEDRHQAMAETLRHTSPAILSSGVTVVSAMLVLLLATLRSTHNMGPVLAIGVALALLAGLTLLPALLQIVGRGAFWPRIPRVDPQQRAQGETPQVGALWGRIGRRVARRPGLAIALTCVVLLACALGGLNAQERLNFMNGVRGNPESARGFSYIAASEPAGLLAPTTIVVRPASAVAPVRQAVRTVARVHLAFLPPVQAGGWTKFSVILDDDPYGAAAMDTIKALRDAVHAAAPAGATVLVGGGSAVQYDTQQAANSDITLIAPAILAVILLILCLLLRAVMAPLYLVATVVLSFLATFGLSVLAFSSFFGFEGIDSGFPTLLFLFLVALGVDYNIFLMSRVREETVRHGTREGTIRGLAATGGIITSAGLILAGTFAVLTALPLKQLVEIGFGVALGVLLDTIVVRSILVPAIVLKVGDWSWWPGRVASKTPTGAHETSLAGERVA
jgi:RND superfamily putative drug exporter